MARASAILASKILIVDDQHANVMVLQIMLQRAGYSQTSFTMDPTEVSDLHAENNYDLILLDIQMPVMNGFQVMQALNQSEPDNYPSILVITAQPRHKILAVQSGAKDFISKPFDQAEVLTRIHYILEVRQLLREAKSHEKFLEETVQARTAELRRSEEMFRELADNIPEALWIKNVQEQTIEYANPAWHNLNGLRAEPGDPIRKGLEAIHPDDREWINHDRRQLPDAKTNNEYRVLRPDQSVRWVQARSFSMANPSGKAPWVVEIIEDVTQKREVQRQLVHLARHDALTGLPNRAFVHDSLREALASAAAGKSAVSMLLLDIDFFKNVNDTQGHAAGDALLREFAARLLTCLRPEDIVGRLGGDEFAIVLSPSGRTDGAQFVADRIRKALKAPLVLEGQEVTVTASIGIANFPDDATDLESLVRCADTALYDAKAAGRNAFRFYTPEMSARAQKKVVIEGALRTAHSEREFVLHYQPKVRIETGKLSSVEALLRWKRPGHGLVMPNSFIPALEEMGLIVPVGAWIVEAACQQIQEWSLEDLQPVRIAVNVSSRQVQEEQFVAQVAAAVNHHGIDPALLEFEITESTFMAHGESTDAALRQLKDLGISLSIDDFGTGYSNLSYLQRFQVDALKIDIAFIREVATNPDAATIAIAIINMAHSLRLKVIAEGVETQEQLDFLRLHGCDEAQGYLLSKPMPANEFLLGLRAITEHGMDLKNAARSRSPAVIHA